jgi:hypothetical protein
MSKTGTVRFEIVPGHPHHGKPVVVLGGVKFKRGVAVVTADDAAKVEPVLTKYHNVGIVGSPEHEEFTRLYAGAVDTADERDTEGKVVKKGKKLTKEQREAAIAKAHVEIEEEKRQAHEAALFGDEEAEELAEINGVRSGTPAAVGGPQAQS